MNVTVTPLHEVPELGQQQTLHREADGRLGSGKRDDDLTGGEPADARLIIAAGPICSKLSMRKSSPKPYSRFSSSPSTASKVQSRDVMPVPPVVMTTCTSADASWRSIVLRTSAGSSVTITRPITLCPAAVSSSAIARPPVSVSSVRVSLMVTI